MGETQNLLNIYSLEQSDAWDAAVRSFKAYDVYWLSGYARAFKLHGDGEPYLYYYENEGIRGIHLVMKRDIAKAPFFKGLLEEKRFFDYSSPYGYGGWLIEGENTEQLFAAYEKQVRAEGIVSEFIRFHPMLRNHEACRDFYQVIGLGTVVHMDLDSPETIWANLTSKNRNMIRKAEKNGLRIYQGRYPAIYETFREIYNATMDKDQADPYYYFEPEFYRSVLEDLPENATVFYAMAEDRIIAASIMLTANGRMNYHLSGSLREYAHLAPTNLLLYKAALWGCANGCRTLYLGGGVGSGEDSLFKFKKAFYRGEDLNRFNNGKKIICEESYRELEDLRNPPEESHYFPRYRA